ncbi:MAG: DUF885 family protein [Verrucomicrobia bacterium]|nr:DUF885 family protein [Verrucomicrobiota bacterium]
MTTENQNSIPVQKLQSNSAKIPRILRVVAIGHGGTANLAVLSGNLPPRRVHQNNRPSDKCIARPTVGLVARQHGPVARSTQTHSTLFCLISCSVVFAASLFLSFPAGAQSPKPETHPAPTDPTLSVMRDVIEQFSTDLGALERFYNLRISETRSAVLRKFYEDQSRRLGAIDFGALDQDGRIDYLLLKARLKADSRQLDHDQKRVAETASLIPFAAPILQLEEARRRMEPIDSPRSAKILADIATQIAKTQSELEKQLKSEKDAASTAPNKVLANRAARIVDELRQALKSWNEFYAGYDPEFTWWASQPFQKTDKSLQDYATFLRKKLAGFVEGEDDPVIGDPIGRAALLDALETEMIPYTPEELIDIANKEFAWCENEWRRAARDLGFGDDWRKALDHVSDIHVKPGEQPRLIKQLADDAVKFLEDRELVTIPELCKSSWRMEMMSPERQKVNPYFTGGEVISVSYPTASMSTEDKLMGMRGNNIHFCRATVHHELMPGHHLQGFMASRYRTHRSAFRTPFLVEGWALYWEMLLWDLNFPKSAEDRVGMLFWRTHRCARIIFSLNFHLGKMTAPEAIDFLVERVGHERRNATAEVRRSVAGDYSPLYQAAYMLGGLQLRALHRELVEAGKMTNREFHDAVLREHEIPIDMIRASLTKLPLARDYTPRWRFYELK